MSTGLIITLVVVGVVILWAVLTYNGLVSRRARVDESWIPPRSARPRVC
jgi:hypothetical protein